MMRSQEFWWLAAVALVVILLLLFPRPPARRAHDPGDSVASLSTAGQEPAAPSAVSEVSAVTEVRRVEDPGGERLTTVRVVDLVSGEPVPGARVVLGDRAESRSAAIEVEVGTFEIVLDSVPGESEWLSVCASGFQCFRVALDPTAAVDVDVELVPLTRLIVRCLTPAGGPVADLEGLVVHLDAPLWARTTAVGESDGGHRMFVSEAEAFVGSGVGVFDGVPAGSGYRIRVSGGSERVEMSLEDVEVPLIPEHEIAVKLRVGAVIRGTVVDCEGEDGGGFKVSCKSVQQIAGRGVRIAAEKEAITEDAGSFSIEGIKPGEKILRFRRRRGERIEAFSWHLTVAAGDRVDLGEVGPVPSAQGGLHLSVRVRLQSGEPVVACAVSIRVDDRKHWQRSVAIDARSDRDGRVEVCGLPQGKVLVFSTAMVDGQVHRGHHEFLAELGEERELDLVLEVGEDALHAGGHVEVQVFDVDGSPVDLRREELVAFLGNPVSGEWVATSLDGRQAEDGTWSVLRLARPPPARYDLAVVGEDRLAWIRGVEVRSGEIVRTRLELEAAAPLRGVVTDASSGAAVGAARVERLFASGGPASRFTFGNRLTDGEGHFELRYFLAGETGEVRVRAEGFNESTVSVVGGRSDVRIDLVPLGQ